MRNGRRRPSGNWVCNRANAAREGRKRRRIHEKRTLPRFPRSRFPRSRFPRSAVTRPGRVFVSEFFLFLPLDLFRISSFGFRISALLRAVATLFHQTLIWPEPSSRAGPSAPANGSATPGPRRTTYGPHSARQTRGRFARPPLTGPDNG